MAAPKRWVVKAQDGSGSGDALDLRSAAAPAERQESSGNVVVFTGSTFVILIFTRDSPPSRRSG